MKKSIAFLTLAALSLTLGGCGGDKSAEKKAEAPKKKGGKEKPHDNPWAIETQSASADAAKAAAKPEKKKKGKEGEQSNPWAKDNPTPASEE